MQPEWHFPYVSKDCIVFMLMNTGGEISKIIIIFSNDICSFPNVPTYFKYWEQTRKFNFLSLIHDLKKNKKTNKQLKLHFIRIFTTQIISYQSS